MSDDTQADPYDTLGLLPGAPPELIRAAFKAQAAIHHPDHNAGSAASHAMMQELTAARDVLTNQDLRKRYDSSIGWQSNAPRTMAEARCLIADMQSTISTQQRQIDAERRRNSQRLQAELDAQRAEILRELEAQLPQAEELFRQRAWAGVQNQVAQLLADRDEVIDELRSELAAARSMPRVVLRAPTPSRHGPARWVLVLALALAALIALGALGLSCHQIATSAAGFGPDAASWPEWLRQPAVIVAVPYVTSVALLALSLATMKREQIWLMVGPILALFGLSLARSSAAAEHVWPGLPDQLAGWLGGYLAVFALAWVLWIVVPWPAKERFRR